MRSLSSARSVVVVSVTFLLVGCKLLDRDKAGNKDQAGSAAVDGKPEIISKNAPATPAPKEQAPAATEPGCVLPGDGIVKADFTISKGCTVTVNRQVRIRDDATLTIEAGATVVMEADRYLSVEKGRLLAKGTEKEPILFTSGAATKAPGDWVGILFEDGVSAGTVLEHVKVEYAGSPRSGGKGALRIRSQRSAGRIAISNVTIERSEQAAVWSDSDNAGFAKFENNHLKNNKWSVNVPASVLGSIGGGNTFVDPLVTWGRVEETVAWPAVDAPIIVERNVIVGGRTSAAVLTIQPKTRVQVAGGRYFSIGDNSGGSLTARDVTFTSANATAQPGDWAGIILRTRATNVDLSGATIEFAGKGSGAKAGLTLQAPATKLPGLKAAGVTFRQNVGAGVSTVDGDCAAFASAKSEPAPACKKN